MREQRERQLIAFIADVLLDGRAETITPDTLLFKARVINSINILDLIGYVERRLGRRLDDHELVMANFESVRAITRTFLSDGR